MPEFCRFRCKQTGNMRNILLINAQPYLKHFHTKYKINATFNSFQTHILLIAIKFLLQHLLSAKDPK